ncbi:MAG: hypothetical protein AAF651_07550, partial [Cyanobacteria bacterium P01_C01_bin.73]
RRAMEFAQTARQQKLDDLVADATARINQAIALLAEKSTLVERREYKELLYTCCDRVAQAAGSRFLHKQRISLEEQAVLEQIKITLDLDPGLA